MRFSRSMRCASSRRATTPMRQIAAREGTSEPGGRHRSPRPRAQQTQVEADIVKSQKELAPTGGTGLHRRFAASAIWKRRKRPITARARNARRPQRCRPRPKPRAAKRRRKRVKAKQASTTAEFNLSSAPCMHSRGPGAGCLFPPGRICQCRHAGRRRTAAGQRVRALLRARGRSREIMLGSAGAYPLRWLCRSELTATISFIASQRGIHPAGHLQHRETARRSGVQGRSATRQMAFPFAPVCPVEVWPVETVTGASAARNVEPQMSRDSPSTCMA